MDVTQAAGLAVIQGAPTADAECGLGAANGCPIQLTGGGRPPISTGMGGWITRVDRADGLYRNQGDGTFVDVTAEARLPLDLPSNGAGFGDIDNDGDVDLYITTIGATRFYLFINDGTGHFSEEGVARGAALGTDEPHFGFSVGFGDYDRDGWLDLHTTEWPHHSFVPPGTASNTRLLRNDRDGDEDVLILRHAQTPVLYRNDRSAGGHSLRVRLKGTRSNRQGFGARLVDKMGSGSTVLVRTLIGGSHFLGQSEPVVHFGLGEADRLAELQVYWPSGTVQTLQNVAAGQLLEVTEPR